MFPELTRLRDDSLDDGVGGDLPEDGELPRQ